MQNITHLAKVTGRSQPTVQSAVDKLTDAGILREVTGRKRNRVFAHSRYLAILEEGTEAAPHDRSA